VKRGNSNRIGSRTVQRNKAGNWIKEKQKFEGKMFRTQQNEVEKRKKKPRLDPTRHQSEWGIKQRRPGCPSNALKMPQKGILKEASHCVENRVGADDDDMWRGVAKHIQLIRKTKRKEG